jgi:hypothetical protein
MRHLIKTGFLAACLALGQVWGDSDFAPYNYNLLENVQFEVGYATGKFISIDKDYAEIGAFAPVIIDDRWAPFVDARGYRFHDGKWAASAGLGLRRNLSECCECSALGVNLYYDYRRGLARTNFHRVGFGLEWLNSCWDARVNGYFPVWRRTQTASTCVFDQIGGGFFATRRKLDFAYTGFDAEVGAPLFNYCDINLYGAAGPYYFYRTHHHHFWGGYGRLELDWKTYLSLEGRVSYDHVHHTQAQGLVRLSVPLDFFYSSCGRCECECDWLLIQPVRRIGILLTDHCCDWKWNWRD